MLALRCTLLRDTFEGALPDNARLPEWPPSWMRLFSALVSVTSFDRDEVKLLERMEGLLPPAIAAATDTATTYRSAFVPTNARDDNAKHTTLPGRTNSERGWARVAPRSPVIWYHWPGEDLAAGERDLLAALCRRVPYFGRSTSPAIVDLAESVPDDIEWLIPAPDDDGESFEFLTTVRCPFPGSLSALREAYTRKYLHGEGGDPWAIGHMVAYGRRGQPAPPGATAGPYQHIVVLGIEGQRLDGRHVARLTTAFRRALMSRIGDVLPAAVHGHHDGSVTQCAYLALPFAGSEHADGHLMGLALAIPPLALPELQAIHRGLDGLHAIEAGPLGTIAVRRLSPVEATRGPLNLRPDTWITPAREWRTVFPMVFDRYLKRGDDPDSAARLAVRYATGIEPEAVITSRFPILDGAVDLAPADTIRRPGEKGFRPYRHALIRFDRPLHGPLVVGSMRHFGLGLCRPMPMGRE